MLTHLLSAILVFTDSDFGLTYAERQLALLTRWGFRCTCDMCSAPEAERNASDTRRQRIRTLRTEVLEHVERREFFAAAKVNEEMLALIEQEGLVPHLGEHHEVVARLLYAAVKEDVKSSANARGDMMNSGTEAGRTDLRKEALKYARMAVEEMEAFGGGDVYDSLDSVRLLVTAIEKELGQGWQGWCKDYDPKP